MNPQLFYVPNLIGYVRLIFMLIGFISFKTHPVLTFTLFGLSAIFDIFDGYFARKLNQQTRYGQVLDFVTDRITIIAGYFILTFIYPDYYILFFFLLLLENGSHIVYLYTAVILKSDNHKLIAQNAPKLLKKYYESNIFMTICIIGHEGFVGFLYLQNFYKNIIISIFLTIYLPIFLLKSWIHLLKIYNSIRICLNAKF